MAELEFRMLGPLEVLRRGEAVPLAPGLPRALLGMLLVHANKVVPTDRLLEELWRGEPPASAGHALQVYVSNLRKLLEPDRDSGVAAEVLLTRRPGYLLVAPPEQRDAGRFELLVEEGGKALDEQLVAEGSRILGEALALWRGPVLADLGDEPFVASEATRLEELRSVATERWAEAELALGRHGELVSKLEALVRLHPFRERLWAQLIVALYRSGRQADALQAYQRLRTSLGEELGLEPSPELRRLETAVLRHDPDLAVPAAVAPAIVAGDGHAAGAAERTPFVGREGRRAGVRPARSPPGSPPISTSPPSPVTARSRRTSTGRTSRPCSCSSTWPSGSTPSTAWSWAPTATRPSKSPPSWRRRSAAWSASAGRG